MADRALRGMRLGTQSKESAVGMELAERRQAVYDCPNGHVLAFPFAIEADAASGNGQAGKFFPFAETHDLLPAAQFDQLQIVRPEDQRQLWSDGAGGNQHHPPVVVRRATQREARIDQRFERPAPDEVHADCRRDFSGCDAVLGSGLPRAGNGDL